MEILTPPHSKESEMMVLGCMLTNPDSLVVAADALNGADFYFTEHKIVFETMQSAYTNNTPSDIHLVCEELTRRKKLKAVGGVGYITTLAQYAGTSAYIEAYVKEVKDKSHLRRLIFEAQEIEKGAFEDPDDVSSFLEKAEKRISILKSDTLYEDSLYRHLLIPASEEEICKEINNISPGARVGMQIGSVDLKLPGGALSIVALPTGHGKTLLLINMILNYLSLHPDKCAFFFSYEESRAAILSLFLNTYINEELSKNNRESIKSYFRDGSPLYIDTNKREPFLRIKDQFFKSCIAKGRLNIFYSNYSGEELVAVLSFLKRNKDIGIVGVDYMQLLNIQNKKKLPRQEELKEVCLILKNCAVNTGLPIVLGAQFNRQVIHEASISPVAIGEAGDIERAANMIIGGWNRNYEGFSTEGNKGKNGSKSPKESAIYLEILKSREEGNGHASVFDLNGNTGKLMAKQIKQQNDLF